MKYDELKILINLRNLSKNVSPTNIKFEKAQFNNYTQITLTKSKKLKMKYET